jgi:hypothetical protein
MNPLNGLKIAKILLRLVSIVATASLVGWLLNGSAVKSESSDSAPAGFKLGMMHGAMMPCAMPNLIMGKDVVIYAPRNNGRMYKLGYTVGVNACGAFFFGLFFWRINRLRKNFNAVRTALANPS